MFAQSVRAVFCIPFAEQKVLDFLCGEDLILKHDWFLVRNLGQHKLQEGGIDCNTAEDEFSRKEL